MAETKIVALGIDVGSTTCKLVAVDRAGRIMAHTVEPTEPRIEEQAARVIAELRTRCGGDHRVPVAATGYGRKRVTAATRVITEITCHARGAFFQLRRPGVLVDFGGQDTKVIRLGQGGEVLDFAMNDKCAAGTGRFLEVILGRLGVTAEQAPAMVRDAPHAVAISSTCTVFAESEVISMVAQGEPVEAIVAGLHTALASRVAALAGRLDSQTEVFISGGVALNKAMSDALAAALATRVEVVPTPQLCGALGAALAVGGL